MQFYASFSTDGSNLVHKTSIKTLMKTQISLIIQMAYILGQNNTVIFDSNHTLDAIQYCRSVFAVDTYTHNSSFLFRASMAAVRLVTHIILYMV